MSDYITDEDGNVLGELTRCRSCRFKEPNRRPEIVPADYWCKKLCRYVYEDNNCCWGDAE